MVYTTGERLGPISFSLHMGHCIVMGEALLVVMVPQEAPRIGTYSHFKMSCLVRPRACRTCLSLTSKMLKQRTRQRGSCYMPTRYVTESKEKIWNMDQQVIKVAPCCPVLWKNSEKQPAEGTVKYSQVWVIQYLSQRVLKDLCFGEDSG